MRNAVTLLQPKHTIACYNTLPIMASAYVHACMRVCVNCMCACVRAVHAFDLCNEVNHIKTSQDRFREVTYIPAISVMRPNILGLQVTAVDRFHCNCTVAWPDSQFLHGHLLRGPTSSDAWGLAHAEKDSESAFICSCQLHILKGHGMLDERAACIGHVCHAC